MRSAVEDYKNQIIEINKCIVQFNLKISLVATYMEKILQNVEGLKSIEVSELPIPDESMFNDSSVTEID